MTTRIRNVACSLIAASFIMSSHELKAQEARFAIRQTDEGVELTESGKPVLFFQTKTKSQNGKWPRANYVHPLYGLDGQVLTEDFPKDHPHHRGVFWAWHQLKWNGESVADPWVCRGIEWLSPSDPKREGGVSTVTDDEQATISIVRDWAVRLEDGTQHRLVRETVVIRVTNSDATSRVVDFTISLRALKPNVSIGGSEDVKGYGGFSPRIRLPDDVEFLGKDGPVEPQKTAVKAGAWMHLSGTLDGAAEKNFGITIMCHPSHPGLPANWILRRKHSMQNVAWPGREPLTLDTNSPTVLRYRLVIDRGDSSPKDIEAQYNDYIEQAVSGRSRQTHQPAPFRHGLGQNPVAGQNQRELMNAYHSSLVQWGRIVSSRVKPVGDRDGELVIGRPGHLENDLRPTAYAAMVLSFLSETEHAGSLLTASDRSEMRNRSIGLLRYLAASHVSNGGTCVNGKSWGNVWQSAMWARAVAMAAWQSWEHLDRPLREGVTKLIVFEADRFIGAQPKSSVRNDTGAEENAWNASITSLACNMLPKHTHAADWETASKQFMYNTFSVKADAKDDTTGDDDRAIKDWVTTVNAHDDFTVENHGLVHVGYLKNSLAMLLENAVHWKLTDRTPPIASQHHVSQVFDLLCRCMNWSGAAIYFGGNDWQIYETQCSDVLIYSALRQLRGNRRAAYLEDVAVKHMIRRQLAEGGYFNGRRDLEYGGLCATRLITCYYLHAMSASLTSPLTRDEFDSASNGVTKLAAARTVLHRTPEKFASFTWAQKRMALAIPSRESSVVWPHFTSYTGVINAEHSSDRYCDVQDLSVNTRDGGFSVSGTLVRCKGQLHHDFFYASPADAYTVYVERLRPSKDFRLNYRKTGVIGLEYPVGQNRRTLFGDFGEHIAQGTDNPKKTHSLQSDWLNVDNQVGYIVRRTDGETNMMLYHDKNHMEARRPHLQEAIVLISENATQLVASNNWACVVTFLNQSADETRAMRDKVRFVSDDNTATLSVGDKQHNISFSQDR